MRDHAPGARSAEAPSTQAMPAPIAAPSVQPRPAPPEVELPDDLVRDRELLAALRAKEAGAVTALHARTRSIIAQTVRRLLGGNDPDSEDMAQLAFIELLKSLEDMREVKVLNAWVRVISSRVVFRHIKRRQVERSLSRALTPQIETGMAWTTPRDFLLRDTLRRVHRHLGRLDANRTRAFLLHDVYGYDMREIARMTGVSLAAARTRLTRGRKEARKRIFSDPELASFK